jgi:hypothetical protein
MELRGEGPEPDVDSAVQVLAAALKRYTSLRRMPTAGGEGRTYVRIHAQGRGRGLEGKRDLSTSEAGMRASGVQAANFCMLGKSWQGRGRGLEGKPAVLRLPSPQTA